MQRLASLAILLAVLGGASPALAGVDRERAQTAPVEDLAQQALKALAPALVEVERPTFKGRRPTEGDVLGLTFATRPRSAGNPGLCEATVVDVSLNPAAAERLGIPPLSTREVFKVVSDLEPLPDVWNDAYGQSLEAKCAQAGRVIPTESADFSQEVFFRMGGDARTNDASLAARILQRAITGSTGEAAPVCVAPFQPEGDPGDDPPEVDPDMICDNPASRVAALKLQALLSVDMAPCPDAPASTCVTGAFLRRGMNNTQYSWYLTVRADVGVTPQALGPLPEKIIVRSVTLTPSYSVTD